MPAYYIGEHVITNAEVFEEYLAKVMPMSAAAMLPIAEQA